MSDVIQPDRNELIARLTMAEAIISRAREAVREEFPRDQVVAILNNPLPVLSVPSPRERAGDEMPNEVERHVANAFEEELEWLDGQDWAGLSVTEYRSIVARHLAMARTTALSSVPSPTEPDNDRENDILSAGTTGYSYGPKDVHRAYMVGRYEQTHGEGSWLKQAAPTEKEIGKK